METVDHTAKPGEPEFPSAVRTPHRQAGGNKFWEIMKKFLMLIAFGVLLLNSSAYAAGCLKGAAVGAVAGHVAGKHAVLGAVGGCVVGRHLAKEKAAQEKAAAQTQAK